MLEAVQTRISRYRSAPGQFVPLLGPALHDSDADVRGATFDLLHRAGSAAARFADTLVDMAGSPAPDPAGRSTPGGSRHFLARHERVPLTALTTLMRLRDPRWIEIGCAAAADGRDISFRSFSPGAMSFGPAVLDRARTALVALTAQAAKDPGARAALAWLVQAFEIWGPPAEAAEVELEAAARWAPEAVGRALAALHTPPERRVDHADRVPELLKLLTGPDRYPYALHRLAVLGAAQALPRLRELLRQETRVISEDDDPDHVWTDEDLMARVRSTIAQLERETRGGPESAGGLPG